MIFINKMGLFGRVVKAADLKSAGTFPRRFEPCSSRILFLPSRISNRWIAISKVVPRSKPVQLLERYRISARKQTNVFQNGYCLTQIALQLEETLVVCLDWHLIIVIFSIDCLFCLCLLKSNRVYFIILHDLFACFRGTATKCNDSKMLSGIVDLEGNGTKANVRNSTQGIPPKGLSAIACLVACAVTAVDFTLPFFNN